jgi:valyl-tRNA synthetase
MPYITEELWQRLPRRSGDETVTVCKAAYPQFTPEFENEKAKKDYDLVFETVKAIRSLTSEYNVKDKAEGKFPPPPFKSNGVLMRLLR